MASGAAIQCMRLAGLIFLLAGCSGLFSEASLEELALLDQRCPGVIQAGSSVEMSTITCMVDIYANSGSLSIGAIWNRLRNKRGPNLPESEAEWVALLSARKKIRETPEGQAMELSADENRAWLRYNQVIK